MIANPPTTSVTSLTDLYEGKEGNVVFLEGDNFSGRSEIIRSLAQLTVNAGGQSLIVPSEIHPALSGLTATVEDELELHLGPDNSNPTYWSLAERWGLLPFRHRDPHSLSGGQQAMLAIICKMAGRPRFLGLDGSLEQLDPTNLLLFLEAISTDEFFSRSSLAVISHNGSWPGKWVPENSVPASVIARPNEFVAPPCLDVDQFNPVPLSCPSTIELKNASFHYPRHKPVFSGLNLNLSSGLIYRISGPNGAGKSTFAKILCGILRLSSGTMSVNGMSFNSYVSPGTLAQLHFQNPDTQLFDVSVAKEIQTLPSEIRASAIQFGGLQGCEDTHPFDLPFVLRKRLALSLILHSTAPWLIFDEPTVGLDWTSQQKVCKALNKLKLAGYGVMLISHNPILDELLRPEVINLHNSSPL